MIHIRDIAAYRIWRANLPAGARVGFVPTMGALHAGHASLARQSLADNDYTVVSIFVNPTQFGPTEDLDRYPRTPDADIALLEALGVDVVFMPEAKEIYPAPPAQITFGIRSLDQKLCGATRPGHMNGVLQVVCILFHLIRPDRAYFGLKDYQQCLIIRQMVRELHFPLEVVPCPIIREADGLAMSSRNRYLSPEERQQALFLTRTLQAVQAQRETFSTPAQALAYVQAQLPHWPGVRLDYFEILNGQDLSDIPDLDARWQPVAFMAAFVGKTRLIDNLPL
ncbi:MAG: pantoate--beta-alanine ligase [Bacteroidia bacterium]|nr:pantoate--beta-alanine ligase [Bacteroidia bacterium]